MTRARVLVGTGIILLLIGVATLAGILVAQEDSLKNILEDKPNDDAVVATVNGVDFTKRDVRLGSDTVRLVAPAVTEDDAIKQSILASIDEVIIQSEVERLGLTPTLEEAREYMAIQKELCMGPDGVECREAIRELGYEPESYWEIVLPGYRDDLGRLRLLRRLHSNWQAKVDEGLIAEEDSGVVRLRILNELRGSAQIEWHDSAIEILYDAAVVARANDLGPPPAPPTPPGGPGDAQGPVGNVND